MSEPPNGNGRAALLNVILSGSVVVIGAILGVFWSQIGDLSRKEGESATKLAAVCSALTEVETQFKAADQIRNLMHKNDVNLIAVLWKKEMGDDYPTADTYLPTIAQDQPAPCR